MSFAKFNETLIFLSDQVTLSREEMLKVSAKTIMSQFTFIFSGQKKHNHHHNNNNKKKGDFLTFALTLIQTSTEETE